ncbi:hypothetical protein HPB47_011271, partial [Ixodes persulcatus]
IKTEPGVDVPEASKATTTMHNAIVRIKKEETPLREKLENHGRLPRCKVEVVHSAQDRKGLQARPRQTIVTVRAPMRTVHTRVVGKSEVALTPALSATPQTKSEPAQHHQSVREQHQQPLEVHKPMSFQPQVPQHHQLELAKHPQFQQPLPPHLQPFYQLPLSHQANKEDMLRCSQESFVKQPQQQQALQPSSVHSIHKHQQAGHKSMSVDDQCSPSEPDPTVNRLGPQQDVQQGLKQPLHDFSNPLHVHHPGLHQPQLEFRKDHFQFHTGQDFSQQEHFGHHHHAISNHQYQELHHQQPQQQQSPSLQQPQQQLLDSPQPELHQLQTPKSLSLQQDLSQHSYTSSMHYPLQQPDPLGFQPLKTTAFAAQPPQPQQTLFQPHMPHFTQSLHQQHYQPYPLYQPQQYHQYSPFQQQQYQYQYQHHLQHRPLLAGPDLVGKLEIPNGM